MREKKKTIRDLDPGDVIYHFKYGTIEMVTIHSISKDTLYLGTTGYTRREVSRDYVGTEWFATKEAAEIYLYHKKKIETIADLRRYQRIIAKLPQEMLREELVQEEIKSSIHELHQLLKFEHEIKGTN